MLKVSATLLALPSSSFDRCKVCNYVRVRVLISPVCFWLVWLVWFVEISSLKQSILPPHTERSAQYPGKCAIKIVIIHEFSLVFLCVAPPNVVSQRLSRQSYYRYHGYIAERKYLPGAEGYSGYRLLSLARHHRGSMASGRSRSGLIEDNNN